MTAQDRGAGPAEGRNATSPSGRGREGGGGGRVRRERGGEKMQLRWPGFYFLSKKKKLLSCWKLREQIQALFKIQECE